ncbi:MAG TPA: PAS domain S-box protein [Dehalococcoidia bacterium]|nr:PAS domain S-box protein [Dehalococcoidia bacterium]
MAETRAWEVGAAGGKASEPRAAPWLPLRLAARHRTALQVAIFCLAAIACFEMGSVIAATGGLPSPYAHLFYPVLVCAAFVLPLWAVTPLAIWAGLVPSYQGFLLVDALAESGAENLLRPLTFLMVGAIVSLISGALQRQAEREAHYGQLLEEEMQRAEESWQALQQSEERYRTLLNTMDEMLLALDLDGRISEVNPAFERVTGWRRDEVLGKHFSWLLAPRTAQKLSQEMERALNEDGPRPIGDLPVRTRSGEWITVEGACAVLRRQGQPVGKVVTAHDVTERRRAEQERAGLLQRLLLAQEEERRRVSYDFHDGPVQLMAAALSFLDSFRSSQKRLDPNHPVAAAHRYLSQALDEARRIISFLRPRELEEHGLVGALQRLASDMAAHSGIEVELDTDVGDLRLSPPVESALFRIAQEAVSNAVRHSGTTRLRIGLSRRGDELVLSVRDWGRGLPEGGILAEGSGGVGLESMRERARFLGAQFSLHSWPGQGTQVTVTLPLPRPSAH